MFKSVAAWVIKWKVIATLNVADTLHRSIIIFERNLWSDCLIYPIWARAEQFRHGGHCAVSFTTTYEQLFPFPYCWATSEVPTFVTEDQTVRWTVAQFRVTQRPTATAEWSHLLLLQQLFGLLKQHFGGRRLQSNEEVEIAVREWLRIHYPELCGSWMLEQVSHWDKCVDLFWLVLNNNDTYIRTYLLTYLLHGAESFLRS